MIVIIRSGMAEPTCGRWQTVAGPIPVVMNKGRSIGGRVIKERHDAQ